MLGFCGSDFIFCSWSWCSFFPKKVNLIKRYELLILLQRSACLALIPDLVQTHNYIEGDLTEQKSITTQASPPACTSSLNPSSLHQAGEVKGGMDLNAYLMSPVTCFISLPTVILEMLTPKGRHSCRLSSTATSPVIRL